MFDSLVDVSHSVTRHSSLFWAAKSDRSHDAATRVAAMFSSPPTSPFSNVSMLYVYQCIGGLVGRLAVPVTLLVGSLPTYCAFGALWPNPMSACLSVGRCW
jgi:hypothetical protein